MVKLLTSVRGRELGISINRPNPDKQGTTPLHAACFRGQQAIVTQLLSRGAQTDAADENGLRALHVACANPDSEPMVRSLLKGKADPNIADDFGCSPIYCECFFLFFFCVLSCLCLLSPSCACFFFLLVNT